MNAILKIRNSLAFLILVFGLVFAVWVFYATYQYKRSDALNRFEEASNDRINAIQIRIERAQTTLAAMQAFFDSSVEVDRFEFRTYAGNMLALDPSIQALGWAPLIRDEGRSALEAAAGIQDYRIYEQEEGGASVPAVRRAYYFPVYYLEARDTARGWLGFDLASEFMLGQDIRLATVTGQPVLSHAYDKFIRHGEEKELLFLQPVYKRGEPAGSDTERLRHRAGVAFSIHHTTDLVNESLRSLSPAGIHVAVVDLLAAPEDRLLHFHVSRKYQSRKTFKVPSIAELEKSEHYTKTLDAGTRKWKIVCLPSAHHWSLMSFWEPWAGAFVTFLITLLGAFSAFLYQKRHDRIEQTVNERTRELQEAQKFLLSEVVSRREAEERLRLFVENSPVAVAMFDTHMHYLAASRRWSEDRGLKGQEIIGKSHYEVFPENKDMPLWLEMHQVCLKGACARNEDEVFIHRDGTKEWMKWEIHPWFKPDQSVGGLIMYVENITARKEAEHKLKEKDEMLQQSQKMEAIGRLAGGVAHDFNNQLTVIKGFASFLERSLTDDDERMTFVEEILIASERATRLTSQLLAFSRKQVHNAVVLKPDEIIAGMTEMMKRLIGEDVEYHYRAGARESSIQIDRGQFEQILINLVVNGRDAMEKGGRLVVDTSTETVGLSGTSGSPQLRPGDYVVVSVTDSGCGIPPDVLPHIFEPFFTTKEKGKGTGLGLATCFGIARQQGGHIAVHTEVGKGTSVRVYFPCVESKAGGSEPERRLSAAEIPPGSETILLCEDEPAIRTVLTSALEARGYKVVSAPDGAAGWRYLCKNGGGVDVIVSDVIMPKMSGRDLMIKAQEAYPSIPILLMSGYTDNSIMSDDIVSGKIDFLHKPFSPEELLLKLYDVLRFRREKHRDKAS